MDTLKLDQNVSELTREQKHAVHRDNGETQWTDYKSVPSLLDQLRGACKPGMEAGSGGGSGIPAPVALNALDLLMGITSTATEYWALYTQTHTVHGSVEDRIRSWAANTRASRDESVEVAERITGKWVDDIKALFDPQKKQEVKAHCPACGARYQYKQEAGETVRQAALQVYVVEGGQSYAECGVCETRWERGQMHLLAEIIEQEDVA